MSKHTWTMSRQLTMDWVASSAEQRAHKMSERGMTAVSGESLIDLVAAHWRAMRFLQEITMMSEQCPSTPEQHKSGSCVCAFVDGFIGEVAEWDAEWAEG